MYQINFSSPSAIAGDTNIYPGKTNVLLFRLYGTNNQGQSNGYFPHLYQIDYLLNGISGAFIERVHFYYDTDGVWNNGNESEARTNNQCRSGVFFDYNYSPNKFGLNGYSYIGPDLGIFVPYHDGRYFYLTADMKTNMPDATAFSVTIPPYCIWNYAGHDWYVDGSKTQSLSAPGEFRTSVTADRLLVNGVPRIAVKNGSFSVTVTAVDQHGNHDVNYTNGIAFFLTNIAPTQWSAQMGSVKNHSLNPVMLNSGSNTFAGQCIISNEGIFRVVAYTTNGGLIQGLSDIILVEPEIHHFDLADQNNLNIGGRIFQSGTALPAYGITNLIVSARDYTGSLLTNYTGSVHFGMDDPIKYYSLPWDNNPATAPTTGTNDRLAFTFGSGTNIVSAENIYFYKSGSFKLYIYDEQRGVKSDFDLRITSGLPHAISAVIKDTCGTEEPMVCELTVYDYWSNVTDWFSGDVRVSTFGLDNGKSNFHTNKIPLVITAGKLSIGKNAGLIINSPGRCSMVFTLADYPSVRSTNTITVNLTDSASSVLLSTGTFFEPGNKLTEARIFCRNDLKKTIQTDVAVFNAAGKEIYRFSPQSIPGGTHELKSWPLIMQNGTAAASGLYFIVLKTEEGSQVTSKIVIVR